MSDSKKSNFDPGSTQAAFPANETGVAEATRLAADFAVAAGLNTRDGTRLGIVAEELASNIVTHGRPREDSVIVMRLTLISNGVRIEMTDRGIAFDPRATVGRAVIEGGGPPDEEGGVGWPLINRWCRIEDYARDGVENRLDLVMQADLTQPGETGG